MSLSLPTHQLSTNFNPTPEQLSFERWREDENFSPYVDEKGDTINTHDISLKFYKQYGDDIDVILKHLNIENFELNFHELMLIVNLVKNIFNTDHIITMNQIIEQDSERKKSIQKISEGTLNKVRQLKKDLSEWKERQLKKLQEQALTENDSVLLKVIEVAQLIESVTSCSLNTFSIASGVLSNNPEHKNDIPSLIDCENNKFLDWADNTQILRKQLKQGKENLFICNLAIGKDGHSLVIHEKRDGEIYKYRIYAGYLHYYSLSEFLAASPLSQKHRGWMSEEELTDLLDKSDRFINKNRAWTKTDIEDYYDCFGERMWNMEGKKPKAKVLAPFTFYSIRKQDDGKFTLPNNQTNYLKVLIIILLAVMVSQITARIIQSEL